MQIFLLNADHSYLNTLSIPSVFRLYFLERIEVVVWSNELIRTPNTSYKIPHIVRLKKYIKEIFSKGLKYKNKNVFARDNYTCQYCGTEKLSGKQLTIDHVKPKSRGGKNNFENVVTACFNCNNYKADRTLNEARMTFFRKGWIPYKPSFIEFLMKDKNYAKIQNKLKELNIF